MKRNRWSLLALALLGGRAFAADGDPVPKVLIVGVDGLRHDALRAAHTPSFDALIEHGCLSETAQVGDITVSGPGWSSLLTGVWRDKHGVSDNSFEGRNYEAYPCFLRHVKQARPDLVTASFVTWMPIDEHIIESSGADIRWAHDYADDGDAKCVMAAAAVLAERDVDVLFYYFADVDVAGHDHGFHPTSPGYLAEIEQTDVQLGVLLAAIRGRASYAEEDWLVLVSSDHGGTLDGAHAGGQPVKRTVPYVASGSAAHRGVLHDTVNVVDLPVTAMAHLGIHADAAWGLDGRVRGLRRPTHFGHNLIDNGDAEASTGADSADVNRGVPGWRDLGGMTVIEYGAPDGYPSSKSAGPPHRGRNFFAGGPGDCTISQRIDVADVADAVDAGTVSFAFGGWLGGYADQRDLTTCTARFLDEHGGERGRAVLGPVTLEDRRRAADGGAVESLTGLLPCAERGSLPAGTRVVEIVLEGEAGSGACDGYADALSFILTTR